MAIGLTFWASTDVWNRFWCSVSTWICLYGDIWILLDLPLGRLDLVGSTLCGIWIIPVKMNCLLYELLLWHSLDHSC